MNPISENPVEASAVTAPIVTEKWWKEAVAYQIYPRSFMDSDGDGVGDLPGITAKLDELKYLGVNVLWICPMYKSPQDDNGYDISDYKDIHAEFGTMKDFDELLAGAHKLGIKVLIDLVINHTSDEHPWFVESRSSRSNPKRDWYIWRDAKSDGRQPNNWESIFGGSAWKFDPATNQYFMHLFSAKQPDLNWENHEMRKAIYEMINWWLDRGIDGFRIDAITHSKKKPDFPDLPNPAGLEFVPSYDGHMNQEGILDYIEDLSANTFRKYDIMTVGEANGVTIKTADQWVGDPANRFNMLFQFEHLGLWSTNPESRIDLPKVKDVFTRWQTGLQGRGWNALYLENHDIPRIVSKWGDTENFWRESATCLANLYFLMQGTPFIYQGQEIGMTNTVFHGREDFDDVRDRNSFAAARAQGIPDEVTTRELAAGSRDNSRTPMQWDASANGGFSAGSKTWLKVNPNYRQINFAAQKGVKGSVLEHYRSLIQLRGSERLWVYGEYDLIAKDHPQVYAYTRALGIKKAVVICNVSPQWATFEVSVFDLKHDHLRLANYEVTPHGEVFAILLRPFESRVYSITNVATVGGGSLPPLQR